MKFDVVFFVLIYSFVDKYFSLISKMNLHVI